MNIHGGSLDSDVIDFSANTSPLGMHPAAERVLHSLALNPESLCSYPDSDCRELRNLLGKFWSFPSDQILCGSGAADLIYEISRHSSFSSIILEPAFLEYSLSLKRKWTSFSKKNSQSEVANSQDETESLIHITDISELEKLSAFNFQFSTCFAASPSNPKGKILSFEEIVRIERFCEEKNAIFVLDSCFVQFSEKASCILRKIISQKENFRNLVVLNAFTKFYGMAGIRLGYGLFFDKKLSEKIESGMRPWAVSSVAQKCGIAVLQVESGVSTLRQSSVTAGSTTEVESGWSGKVLGLVEKEKLRFYEFFDSFNIKYEKSEGNFILFRLEENFSGKMKSDSERPQISILESASHIRFALRNCSDFFGLDSNTFRIAIKSPEENTKLLQAFYETFSQMQISKLSSRKALPLMVQGTMSNAGKSLLVAALCRIFRKDGFKVAPFKSQNMALNSGVTLDGLEMGRAQILQAEAAGILPDVRMNPILLKPNSDTGSQIIVNGIAKGSMSAKDYFSCRKNLIPEILSAYNSLAEENDIIVIEGAGSPAEINLKENDIVNMGLAELVDAPVLLAGDIDRGGVFASLYGTFALVTESERKRIKGFLINKFRGDVNLLENGLEMLRNLTGVSVLGVVPYIKNLKLDEEDSLSLRETDGWREERGKWKVESGRNLIIPHSAFASCGATWQLSQSESAIPHLSIYVVKLPYISNFTDLDPFYNLDFVNLQYFDSVEEYDSLCQKFGKPDLIILPGTKNTIHAMEFLEKTKLSSIIKDFASENPVIGICGGYQILGETLDDSEGNEDSSKKIMKGLGLLPFGTKFNSRKTLVQVSETLPEIQGFYSELSGKKLEGYEIHSGEWKVESGEWKVERGVSTGSTTKWREGILNSQFSTLNYTFGTYVHGFFDNTEILKAIVKILCRKKNISLPDMSKILSEKEIKERELDRLEKTVRDSLNMEEIYRIVGLKKN